VEPLAPHVRGAGLGHVLGASAGYVVQRGPDRVLSPDVSFLARWRGARLPRVGFVEGAPDLAVEVRSPGDSWTSVIEKGGIWIAHRVAVVWCVDPLERRVVVLRPREAP
jgi:Uma2 family endonuclease